MLRLRAAMAGMKVWTTKRVRSSVPTEIKNRDPGSFNTNRDRGFFAFELTRYYVEHVLLGVVDCCDLPVPFGGNGPDHRMAALRVCKCMIQRDHRQEQNDSRPLKCRLNKSASRTLRVRRLKFPDGENN